ncbi:family 20 glycosylhydrolase [Pseudoalteromonas fenneropenaei]|uniref:Family 20 glycosylhydrolase n=1 Tax=Pseudoalteromonas fenneropenaei TaxID=1737459 RepID=A0ABV7CJG8_9GAMM
MFKTCFANLTSAALLILALLTTTPLFASDYLMPKPYAVNVSTNNVATKAVQLPATLSVQLPQAHQQALLPLLEHSALAKQVTFAWQPQGFLKIDIDTLAPATPSLEQDESYTLTLTAEQLTLKSANQYGMLRGLASLSQLYFQQQHSGFVAEQQLVDKPHYRWRGLLFDSVRHFLPLADVKRTLDGLAAAKFNVFHWHLTDDQGWRIELNSYPKLHQLASDGLYYSQAEIREVVAYAAKLGIRVVPEFDVPGHASAIIKAYPELGSGEPVTEIERHWGVFRPLLDPSNPAVYEFVDQVVAELSGLFPDPYLHIGGDEVEPHDWLNNPKIQAFMAANQLQDAEALHAYFNQRVSTILRKHHKTMIGWDEVLHPMLDKSTLVQSWRGHHSLRAIQQAGFAGLLSSGYYIDQPQWTSYHYRNHPQPLETPIKQADTLLPAAEFTLTRLKGAAVTGKVQLFSYQGQLAAWLAINGKGEFVTTQVQQTERAYVVNVDTWLGPTKLSIGKKPQHNHAEIGNTAYQFAATAIEPLSLSALNTQLSEVAEQVLEGKVIGGEVLGGEATIWSEIITTANLDVRIWPRLFAIGERFWSAPTVQDERDMYRRLAFASDYATQVVGLRHQRQAIQHLAMLAEQASWPAPYSLTALKWLSQFLEPVHYYTLHHQAFLRGEYHQLAPLNRLADGLPVESLTLIQLAYDINDYAKQCKPQQHAAITAQINTWQNQWRQLQGQLANHTEWAALMKTLGAQLAMNSTNVPAIYEHQGVIVRVGELLAQFKAAAQTCRSYLK